MKLFNDGVEMRLNRDDLTKLLEEILNQKFFIPGAGRKTVSNLTLHPNNIYVVRITVNSENDKH